MHDVERRLTATLERVAAKTRASDRWDEVAASAAPRRPARMGWAAVAAGFAVVVAAVALVPALLRTAPAPLSPADAPPLAEDEPAVTRPGPAATALAYADGLPRLGLALPDATLVHAGEDRLPADAGVPGPDPGYHQYFAASDHLAPPLLHVVSWTGPDAAGLPDAESQVVRVRGTDAVLTAVGQFATLEWRDPEVSYVKVEAAGLPAGEVVALAEAMELRDDPARGFDLAGLPGPMAVVYEGRSPDPDPAFVAGHSTTVTYALAGGDEVSIRLRAADRPLPRNVQAILGIAWDAEAFEAAEVRGAPAVLAQTGPEHFLAVWREGAVIGVLDANVPRSRLPEVVAAIDEVTEDEWQQSLAAAPFHPDQFSEGFEVELPTADDEAQEVLREACATAGRWFEFRTGAFDAAAEAEAAGLAELVAESEAVLAAAPPNYATVVRRLAAAVATGDLAAVEAEFTGTEFGGPQCE